MSAQSLGRALLAFVIVTTVLIVAVADVFNATHLFNPDWPPHARFHIAMQASTLLLTSLVSLRGLRQSRYGIAVIAPATFWPGLFMALPVPGTTVYATASLAEAGVPINLIIAGAWLALTALGYRLATRPALAPDQAVSRQRCSLQETGGGPNRDGPRTVDGNTQHTHRGASALL